MNNPNITMRDLSMEDLRWELDRALDADDTRTENRIMREIRNREERDRIEIN